MARRKSSEAPSSLSSATRVTVRTKSSQVVELQASTTPAAGSRRSKRLSTVVQNSSSVGSDGSEDELCDGYLNGPSRWSVKAVNVPMKAKQNTTSLRHQPKSPSTVSSDSSAEQTGHMDTDTPATSVAATPAELSVNKRPKRGIMAAASRALEASPLISNTKSAVARGKSKRTAEQDQLEEDEMIARTLQEEEYGSIQVKSNVSKGKKRLVPDSEDEEIDESELSEFTEPDISREASVESDKPLAKRARKNTKHTSVRLSAPPFTVPDTDASSALSDPDDSEVDFDGAMDISETEDDGEEDDQSKPTKKRWKRRDMVGMPRAERERMKLENAHPVLVTLWEQLEKVPVIKPEQRPQPPDITRKLKPFQLEGLDWMCKQEQTQWKGGLLGDEMGMGKTIQAVSLIMSDYPAKNPTLVLVPPVALMQWSSEIASYTDGKLKVLVYHNSDAKVKKLTMKDLKKYDVIMISYSSLESMYRKESKGWKRDDGLVKENSKIHAIHYHRVILDEAHSIKTRTTGVAKACFALNANYKWCLSGTPVQNRIGEFFSLLRFLEVTPFASYFCKTCSCAELHWAQDERKRCTHCGHSGFQHVSIFNQELLNPITSATDAEARKEAFGKLRLLTDRIMLRRVKRNNTASMELPPKEVIVHNEFFSPVEVDFSSSIMSNSERRFDTFVSRGVMLKNYANIFTLLMSMRQTAVHPDLMLRKSSHEGGGNTLNCVICDEVCEEAIRSRCRHEFCRQCARNYINSCADSRGFGSAVPDCPKCHIPLSIDFDQPDIEQDEEAVAKGSIVNRIDTQNWTSSTKIESLIYDLYRLRSKKQTKKSIVFSQFTTALDLIDWRLRRAGFSTVRLEGNMTPAQRQRSVDYFMNNVDVEVFLVSLKAGGVALNLTEASRVYIVDPWWNPAAEWQSADRCHRIGQRRPCVITRMCIEDSVESRIIQLQAKKANMIATTVDNDSAAMDRLAPEDMMFLFRGN